VIEIDNLQRVIDIWRVFFKYGNERERKKVREGDKEGKREKRKSERERDRREREIDR
jgi:hypothetical protein